MAEKVLIGITGPEGDKIGRPDKIVSKSVTETQDI